MAKAALKMSDKDRYKVYDDLVDLLWNYNPAWVAEQAKVSLPTLYNWMNANVLRPRIDTLFKVANVLGYDIVLVKRATEPRPKPKLRLVKR